MESKDKAIAFDLKANNSQPRTMLKMVLAGIASMAAGSFTHPIDTTKVVVQNSQKAKNSIVDQNLSIRKIVADIYKTNGLKGFYKGLIPSIVRQGTYSTLRLGLYQPYKNMLSIQDQQNTPFWQKFLAGFMSGSSGALIANPADLLKVRLQANAVKSSNSTADSEIVKQTLMGQIQNIYQAEGVLGFWRGLVPNITRGAILTATKMATYDETQYQIQKHLKWEDGRKNQILSAFVTGFVITCVTSPLDNLQTKIMAASPGAYRGMIDCAAKLVRSQGFGSLYKGFLLQWSRFGPFNFIQLLTWEILCNQFHFAAIQI